jgi:hypothetical protein
MSTYPDVGAPASIATLSGRTGEEPSPDHAILIDERLGTPPYEKDGYRFGYRQVDREKYVITARPLHFGEEGSRSFFTDESGVIRSKTEDRDPTSEDRPLE